MRFHFRLQAHVLSATRRHRDIDLAEVGKLPEVRVD